MATIEVGRLQIKGDSGLDVIESQSKTSKATSRTCLQSDSLFVFVSTMEGRLLSHDQVLRFQKAYKEALGKEIDLDEATRKAIALYGLVSVVYTPISRAQYARARLEVDELRRSIFSSAQTCNNGRESEVENPLARNP